MFKSISKFLCSAATLTALVGAAFAAAPEPQRAQSSPSSNGSSAAWPDGSPAHQAILCGRVGAEEASAAYSSAVVKRLRELERQGLTTSQAIEHLRRGVCQGEPTSGVAK